MEIGAAEYRAAAQEHLGAASQCPQNGDYLTSRYLCGLAVECILRAYRWKIDEQWDGRHVLPRLYKEAKFDVLVSDVETESAARFLTVVTSRWSNEHRFTSPKKLEAHLNAVRATHNVRGDKLKYSSAEMVEAAEFFVGLGIRKWKN